MRLILTLFLVVITTAAWSQNTFMKTLGTPASDYGTVCIPTPDLGTLLVTGGGMSVGAGVQFGLAKTDHNGTIQWEKVYNHGNFALAYAAVQASDGGFVVLGNIDQNYPNKALFLMKTDAQGNELWNYSISASANDRPVALISCQSGGYLSCSINNYNTGGYPNGQLIRFDENGTILWTKKYSIMYGLEPRAVIELPSGDFAFVSSVNAGFLNYTRHTMITRTDAQGTPTWSRLFYTEYDDEPYDLVCDAAGRLFVTGASIFVNTHWDGFLLRVEADGSNAHNLFYDAGTSNGEIWRQLALTDDGTVLLLGDKGTFDERDITMLEVDADGVPIWVNSYPISPQYTNYPADMYMVGNSGIVFTGDVRPPSYVRDAALFRTDRNGMIACYMQPVQVTTNDLPFTHMTAYPTATEEPIPTQNAIAFTYPATAITEKIICNNPGPIPHNSWEQTADCPALCFDFHDASLNDPVAWLWEFEGGVPATSNEENPQGICFLNPGTYNITLTVFNVQGSAQIEKQLLIEDNGCPMSEIPNVITPNGDGINDEFIITGLPDEFTLTVYNRWGEKVFETSDKKQFWSGKTEQGLPVSDGVYFYRLASPTNTYHGFIHVQH